MYKINNNNNTNKNHDGDEEELKMYEIAVSKHHVGQRIKTR